MTTLGAGPGPAARLDRNKRAEAYKRWHAWYYQSSDHPPTSEESFNAGWTERVAGREDGEKRTASGQIREDAEKLINALIEGQRLVLNTSYDPRHTDEQFALACDKRLAARTALLAALLGEAPPTKEAEPTPAKPNFNGADIYTLNRAADWYEANKWGNWPDWPTCWRSLQPLIDWAIEFPIPVRATKEKEIENG